MTESRPIILVGAARSGTKFLRDILASGTGMAVVPYDVNYVWRYGAERVEHDALDPSDLTDKRKSFIRRTLRSLAKSDPDGILIEKTVATTLRVPFVDAVFPDARYIHLIRDGRDVAESAMRQWEAPPDWPALSRKVREMPLANLSYIAWYGMNFLSGLFAGRKGGKVWGPQFPGMDDLAESVTLSEVCARQWLESVIRARHDLAAIPGADERVFTIRYEALIGDETALTDLLAKLDLPDSGSILRTYRDRLRPSDPARWRDLPEEDRQVFDRVLTPTLQELGYLE